ncbi:competence type IV pilus minor pilin ComGE [Streptococcus sp. 27098_8_148]|uniref:competence type IV pilus minor pilin ComGE n=1 Tax=Streptococcus sp. 27098_8_148 TaxID=3003652 RepID=UPI00352E16AA
MGKLKKASVPASILIESLVALGLFAMITTLLLGEIRRSRRERLADFKEVEVLSVVQMALQTGQNHLEANGIQVQVEKDADQLTVYHQGKVVLHVE